MKNHTTYLPGDFFRGYEWSLQSYAMQLEDDRKLSLKLRTELIPLAKRLFRVERYDEAFSSFRNYLGILNEMENHDADSRSLTNVLKFFVGFANAVEYYRQKNFPAAIKRFSGLRYKLLRDETNSSDRRILLRRSAKLLGKCTNIMAEQAEERLSAEIEHASGSGRSFRRGRRD